MVDLQEVILQAYQVYLPVIGKMNLHTMYYFSFIGAVVRPVGHWTENNTVKVECIQA